jgi:Mrp family chromosome partitioning ATPase
LSTHVTAGQRSAGEYPDLARVASLAARWWPVLLITAFAAGAIAAKVGARTERTYQAQARLLVGPLDGEPGDLRAASQQAQTLSQLATSRPVLAATKVRLGRRAPADLPRVVRADATGTTRVLVISAETTNAATAAATANAAAAELQALMHDSGSTLVGGSSLAGGRLRVIDPAVRPEEPTGTGIAPLVASAALTGFLVALVLVLLADYFRGRIATEDDMREVSGLAHLATIKRAPRRGSKLAAERPDSDAAAAFRLLAGRVALSAPDGPRRVLITGVQAGDGAGRVAVDLAATIAAAGTRTILVDADADGAEATRMLGLGARPGLGELLDDMTSSAARPDLAPLTVESVPGLRVVPRGSLDGYGSLAPERAARALEYLTSACDVVVVSGGPAGASAAPLSWARLVDGTVLVARRGHTGRHALAHAVDALDHVDAEILGTVLAERGGRRVRAALRRRLSRLRPPAAPSPEGAGGLPS